MVWRVDILDRFYPSARLLAPPATDRASAVGSVLASLANGPSVEDRPYLVPPCLWAFWRPTTVGDLGVVFVERPRSRIRVLAVAKMPSR